MLNQSLSPQTINADPVMFSSDRLLLLLAHQEHWSMLALLLINWLALVRSPCVHHHRHSSSSSCSPVTVICALQLLSWLPCGQGDLLDPLPITPVVDASPTAPALQHHDHHRHQQK